MPKDKESTISKREFSTLRIIVDKIRDELRDHGFPDNYQFHFEVDKENGKFELTVTPFDDTYAFFETDKSQAEIYRQTMKKFDYAKKNTFRGNENISLKRDGGYYKEYCARTINDMIDGFNSGLSEKNQVDLSMLGKGL